MGSVAVEGMETKKMESMVDVGEKMTMELRAELHRTEVQLSHWVAEREQRLSDIQVWCIVCSHSCAVVG